MDDVRYAVNDGVHIAFREVIGDPSSDATLLLLSGQLLPMQSSWDDHGHARFLDGLAALGRLIVFDRRGIGLSDPVTDWTINIYDQWREDAISVLDACGVDKAQLVGWEMGASLAFELASLHPDRVSGVAVLHGIDRKDRLELAGVASTDDLADAMAEWIETGEASDLVGTDPFFYAPSRAGDPSLVAWLDEAGRLGASPATAARIWRSVLTSESEGIDLADLVCPILLLWRRDNAVWGPEMGRAIAADYESVEYVELAGADFAPYSGDVDELVREIHRFVHGSYRNVGSSDRQLAVLLFTDIVGSTESVSSIGDQPWRGTLDAHDQIVQRVVSRQSGTVIKQTGDGALSTFGLASQAIRAAIGLREELRPLGLRIRQGIHAGEVSVRGHDVSGIALHVASRIMSLAEPDEILTSATIPALIEGDPFNFDPRNRTTLRGLPGIREIFVLTD